MMMDSWQKQNLARIQERLQWLNAKEEGIIHFAKSDSNEIFIVKSKSEICLLYAGKDENHGTVKLSGVMSRIDLKSPLVLKSAYTQGMILTLLWQPDPKRIHLMGFGGGRIPMILHHHLPELIIDSTETETEMADLATSYFGICPDERLRIFFQDSRQFLETRSDKDKYQIIMVDCFTGGGYHPIHLSTVEFYQLCKKHLDPDGVVATNLVVMDPLFREKVRTLKASFRNVYHYNRSQTHIFFGTDADPLTKTELFQRAKAVHRQRKFFFPFSPNTNYIRLLTGAKDYLDLPERLLMDPITDSSAT